MIEGKTAVIQIPAADWDRTNDVRCRWASSTGAAGNECDDVCSNFPNATLSTRLVNAFTSSTECLKGNSPFEILYYSRIVEDIVLII